MGRISIDCKDNRVVCTGMDQTHIWFKCKWGCKKNHYHGSKPEWLSQKTGRFIEHRVSHCPYREEDYYIEITPNTKRVLKKEHK